MNVQRTPDELEWKLHLAEERAEANFGAATNIAIQRDELLAALTGMVELHEERESFLKREYKDVRVAVARAAIAKATEETKR